MEEEPDPVTHELFELFDGVHMMIFYIMLSFICLVGVLLGQAKVTAAKFELSEHCKMRLAGKPTTGISPRANPRSSIIPSPRFFQELSTREMLLAGRNFIRLSPQKMYTMLRGLTCHVIIRDSYSFQVGYSF